MPPPALSPKKAGSYRVRAIGLDGYENEVRSATYLWVWGGDEYVSWRQESNNRITLIADKQEYQVGDTAEILVASPYSGTVQALITVERGHLMDTDVREITTNSYVLRVPILEEMVPNVFVSVILVQGSEQAPNELATFKMGVIKLPISLASKQLTITLTPDKDMEAGEHYAPRQTATYDVLVTDNAGEPVEAELSLRLADLAVLALADESSYTLEQAFWRSRGLGVRTSLPLAVSMEAYNRELQPAAKGGGGGDEGGLFRSNFADTDLLGSGGPHRQGRQGPGGGGVGRQPDDLAHAGARHHGRHAGRPGQRRYRQHARSARAACAAPLLHRERRGRDRHRRAQQHWHAAPGRGQHHRRRPRRRRRHDAAGQHRRPASRPRWSGRSRCSPAKRSRCACGPRPATSTTAARTPCRSIRYSTPEVVATAGQLDRARRSARRLSSFRRTSMRPRAASPSRSTAR